MSKPTTARELLDLHVGVLHRKVRGALLDALADDLTRSSTKPVRSDIEQLVSMVVRMQQISQDKVSELGTIEQRWREFERRLFHAPAKGRRQVLRDYLQESVADPRERRLDLAALDRYLDYDALRERHLIARHQVLVALEIAVTFVGNATAAAVERSRSKAGKVREIFEDTRVLELLQAIGETGARWQLRAAALDGLIRCAELARERDPSWLGQLASKHLGLAVRCATNHDEHAWVQGRAMRLVLALNFDLGIDLLARRLLDPAAAEPDIIDRAMVGRRDFLVRRQCVDLLAADRDERTLELLRQAQARRDPSEHVRQGIAEALAIRGELIAVRGLVGLDRSQPEPSARVRAVAVQALCRHARTPDLAAVVAQLVLEVLVTETAALPLTVACEDITELIAREAPSSNLVQRLLTELLRLSARDDRPAPVRESAAAAAERVALGMVQEYRAWRDQIAALAGDIRLGKARTFSLDDFPHLPPLPEDPAFLGRILASLSRTDHPLFATRTGRTIKLWRGDRYRRRLWRILHELKRPAPNKRQAHRHTVGRVMRGRLRAPPGGLDEVTATVVPGERLYVAEEGGWGRHLPTVDDMLDLPLAGGSIQVYSSHGVTTVRQPGSWWSRLVNRVALSRRYARLADLRIQSLRGTEPHVRQRYSDELRAFGIELDFRRHEYMHNPTTVPTALSTLFPPIVPPPPAARMGGGAAAMAAVPASFGELGDWIGEKGAYFTSLQSNGQLALALFLVLFAAVFLATAYRKRARIDRARARLPLTIGGWGTRGKSGTERLKAAVFHGLGYEVSVKTTGCEAMMIHSVPDEAPHEIFIFRSYDKATIWEQRDIVETAAALKSEVFLWECMALQPEFVELLQKDWMRDDYVTLTNAFPDHEDVQGPTGADVADCISRFIPRDGTLITSEVNFLPLFQERCRERRTELHVTTPRSAKLIAGDVLALFPYNEHPRNISLVADLSTELGLDRNLAIATMAEHVVPDLGVLKAYPAARIRSRTMRFLNGMSANERTGFLNNWDRMALGSKDVEDPREAVVTVVNNRWDRVARSEVFARIMVEDAVVDAHVMIGTNLRGLRRYVDDALRRYLETIVVVIDDDLAAAGGAERATQRLATQLARLRVPAPVPHAIVARIETYAAGAGLAIDQAHYPNLVRIADELCVPAPEASLDLAEATREVAARLEPLAQMLVPASSTSPHPEVLEPSSLAEVMEHVVRHATRIALHARLRARLAAVFAHRGSALAEVNAAVRGVYRELFEALLIVVDDSGETGDQIIDRCARAVPPGTTVSVMGIQNIKGTGLDFVYRWLALDGTMVRLGRLGSTDPAVRITALRELESFEDYGLVDAGVAVAVLAAHVEQDRALGDDEALHARRTLERVRGIHEEAKRALAKAEGKGGWTRFAAPIEALLDPLDSMHRRRKATQVIDDLIAHRISHGRAAKEMRGLYDRQGGGWLTRRA